MSFSLSLSSVCVFNNFAPSCCRARHAEGTDAKSSNGSVYDTLHRVGFVIVQNLCVLNGSEHNTADGNYAHSGPRLTLHVQPESGQRSGRVNAALMRVPIGACERDNRRATYRTIFSQAR